MDIILSSDADGIFSIFGWGFIAGAMFTTVIALIFEWINSRTREHKQKLVNIELPSSYQS
jgi:hypothetical protein